MARTDIIIIRPKPPIHHVPCQYCGELVERRQVGFRKFTCFKCKQKAKSNRSYPHVVN